MIVEDCAQGLYAAASGKPTGRVGDVSCFSLIKNAYGIGGGILATNDVSLYEKAKAFQQEMEKPSAKLILFRIVRNIIETYRHTRAGEKLYRRFMGIRGKVKTEESSDDPFAELKLRQPAAMEIRIAASQFGRARRLNRKRQANGKRLLEKLRQNGLLNNYSQVDGHDPSFVKFYLYHPKYRSEVHIPLLQQKGVEAKHLEHSFDSQVQERLADEAAVRKNHLENYNKIHEHLLSIPLTEKLSDSDIDRMVELLNEI
jgi:dTDP-4-amino-4,6-dideoxygalactose transaminase